jgi:hypothetical protein
MIEETHRVPHLERNPPWSSGGLLPLNKFHLTDLSHLVSPGRQDFFSSTAYRFSQRHLRVMNLVIHRNIYSRRHDY